MEIPKQELKLIRSFTRPFRVTRGKGFELRDFDPGDTLNLVSEDKPRAQQALQKGIGYLAALQDRLYAQDRWSVLLVFQAMDAAGKDSAIKHVLSGVNPQGCHVTSFKAPSAESASHSPISRVVHAVNACVWYPSEPSCKAGQRRDGKMAPLHDHRGLASRLVNPRAGVPCRVPVRRSRAGAHVIRGRRRNGR